MGRETRSAAGHLAGLEQSAPVFDRATRLARSLFGHPANPVEAQVTLVSDAGVWRSRDGLRPVEGEASGVREVMRTGDLLWVADAREDARFRDDPTVAEPPYVRFFAGAPIRLEDGSSPGAIWVAGLTPRAYDPALARGLQDLADVVADEWTRIRAREAKSVYERTLAAIIEAMPVSLVLTDRDMRLLYASRPWIEARGLTGQDVVGRTLFELRPDIFQQWRDGLAACVANGSRHKVERHVLPRAGGGSDWARVEVSPWLEVDGAVGGLIMVSYDITEVVEALERAERQEGALIRARDEAEAANRAKSAFLATMSHEIRTPLNGVLGMAQAMAADALSPDQADRLDVIRQSGESLLTILNDVLDLSKIEAGKLDLEEAEFDVAELAQAVHATFGAVAESKGLAFELTVERGARGIYRGDPVRVRQVLWNLVSNALKFTDRGAVKVRVARKGGELAFEVTDSGIGIAPEQLVNLFRKFEQADASTTRRFGGTGLGLAICRELTELMGGEIAATSARGHGAVFTVRLPLEKLARRKAPPKPRAEPAPQEAASERPLRVLAAEDNTMNQLVLKTLLAQVGVEPVIVPDGREAVAAWEREPWDVILMDIQMPVMDGPTATALIRTREVALRRPRTPIVALTANAMSHQVAEYVEAGMDGYVAKPIEAARLYEALQTALDQGEAARAAAA